MEQIEGSEVNSRESSAGMCFGICGCSVLDVKVHLELLRPVLGSAQSPPVQEGPGRWGLLTWMVAGSWNGLGWKAPSWAGTAPAGWGWEY